MDGEEEPRPGNFDRAWNDPPLFSYKGDAPTAGGLKLNKRVMYPSSPVQPPSSGEASSNSCTKLHDAGAKMIPTTDLPPPPPTQTIASGFSSKDKKPPSSSSTLEVVSDEDRDQTIEILRNMLTHFGSRIESRKSQDIRKRLDTMESKWKDGSLTFPVERGLCALAKAIEKSEFDEADKIQRKLMVDWPSQCGTWLVGIKHLIFEAKNRESDDKPDEN